MRLFIGLALSVSAVMATWSLRADVAAGVAAFQRGDFALAVQELQASASQGDARAQYLMGVIYLNGFVEPPAPEAAVEWLRKAAEQNYVDAQTELGRMYQEGHGVEADPVEMVKWYERAANQGDVGAQLFVADAYAYGYGIEQDYVKAYTWYEIAIQYWGELAVHAREAIAAQMSSEQIADAVRLAGEWLQTTAK